MGEKSNVAALANAVIGKSGIKPTVQLYMRLAFLVSYLMLWSSCHWHSHVEVAYRNLCKPRWWEVVASGWWKPGFVAKAIQHRTAVVHVHYCANSFMSFSFHWCYLLVPSPVCMPKIKLRMGTPPSLHSKSLRSENLTTADRPADPCEKCWAAKLQKAQGAAIRRVRGYGARYGMVICGARQPNLLCIWMKIIFFRK